MALSIAKVANWLHQVDKARAVVGWWPAQFATDDERLAYKVQDAFLKKQVVKQGPLAGYKIALTSPQILAADRPQGPVLRPDPQEARVRAQGHRARRPLDAARRRARGHLHHGRRRAEAEGQALRQGLRSPSMSARRAPASS